MLDATPAASEEPARTRLMRMLLRRGDTVLSEFQSPSPPNELRFSAGAALEIACFIESALASTGAAAASITSTGHCATALHVHVNVRNRAAGGVPLSPRQILRVVYAWIRFDHVTQAFARPWLWCEPSCAPLYATGPELDPNSLDPCLDATADTAVAATAEADAALDAAPFSSLELDVAEAEAAGGTGSPLDEWRARHAVTERSRVVLAVARRLREEERRRAAAAAAFACRVARLRAGEKVDADASLSEGFETTAGAGQRWRSYEAAAQRTLYDVPAFVHAAHAIVTAAGFDAQPEAEQLRQLFGGEASPGGRLGRYCSLNLGAIAKFGTLEMRRFHGTLDSALVVRWAHFCVAFVECFAGPAGSSGSNLAAATLPTVASTTTAAGAATAEARSAGATAGPAAPGGAEQAPHTPSHSSADAALLALQTAQETASADELMVCMAGHVSPSTATFFRQNNQSPRQN